MQILENVPRGRLVRQVGAAAPASVAIWRCDERGGPRHQQGPLPQGIEEETLCANRANLS